MRTTQPDRFEPATSATLRILAELNRDLRPNLLFAGLAITAESAQFGYLLSALHGESTKFLSLLTNSCEEAISAVIRLGRHSANAARRDAAAILVLDPSGRLRNYFNPAADSSCHDLVPDVSFVDDTELAAVALDEGHWSALIVDLVGDLGAASSLVERARARGVLSAVCDSRPIAPSDDAGLLPAAGMHADMYIYGENLVGGQLPFGVLLMSPAAYSVWDNPLDAMSQGSTFAASTAALTIAIAELRSKSYVNDHHSDTLHLISTSRRARNTYYANNVNPHAVVLLESFGLDFEFRSASGMIMQLSDGRSLCDCTAGMGSNLRGHNPADLADAVLARHDPQADYAAELAGFLAELSGFDEVLFAVSGTTAVENALIIARLARTGRRTIVTFTGNFSGRSAAPLSLSRTGPPLSSSIPDAYQPYYPHLVYVDPFADDAEDRLRAVLADPDVGLVWLELIQGSSCRLIPDSLLRVIAGAKEQSNFLVGVDEILTGVWRAGEGFLYHPGHLDVVDLVAISKPMSDMTVPVAAALATSRVVADAAAHDAAAVEAVRTRYPNQLSAHIALHALRSVNNPRSHRDRLQCREILRAGLDRLVADSKLYEGVSGAGAMLRLVPNRKYFPFPPGHLINEMTESSFESTVLDRCQVILSRGRFLFPVFTDPVHIDETANRLQRLADVTPAAVYRRATINVVQLFSHMFRLRVRSCFEQLRGSQRS